MFGSKLFPVVLLVTIFFYSCTDDNTSEPPASYNFYTVRFKITGDSEPAALATLSFDAKLFTADSSGLVKIDSVMEGMHSFTVNHKKLIPHSAYINISSDALFEIPLELRSHSFFPDQPGSKWIFRNEWDKLTIKTEAADVVEINNRLYTRFVSHAVQDSGILPPPYEQYFRTMQDTVYQYFPEYGYETIYAVFNTPVGSTFDYITGEGGLRMVQTGTIYYKDNSLIKIQYDNPMAWDDEFTIFFRKGVGEEYKIYAWVVYNLLDYEIAYVLGQVH